VSVLLGNISNNISELPRIAAGLLSFAGERSTLSLELLSPARDRLNLSLELSKLSGERLSLAGEGMERWRRPRTACADLKLNASEVTRDFKNTSLYGLG